MEPYQFWKSISVLLKYYPVVDRNVYACKSEQTYKVIDGISTIDLGDIKISSLYGNLVVSDDYTDLHFTDCSDYEALNDLNSGVIPDDCEGYIMGIRFLTLDDEEDTVDAVIIIDFVNPRFTCVFQSDTYYNFQIAFEEGEFVVYVNYKQDPEPSEWADIVLKPKLVKWSNAVYAQENPTVSLDLIDVESYNNLFTNLKEKYSEELINIWAESTDPLKLIFEDISIAAYLICLWREYGCEPYVFADISCGNGALVYVLTQEGYEGYGYDVKRRKIWDFYPNPNLFYERDITITDFRIPVDVDWVIGNHSDELTPWIPVMTGLASAHIRYFLLPCCPYELSGTKFQHRQLNLSPYDDYIQYLEAVSKKCGFITLKDRLPSPITGRMAVIGLARTYIELDHQIISWDIQEYLKDELPENAVRDWRRHEAVRDCNQSENPELIEIIKKIFLHLLTPKQRDGSWNEGIQRTLNEIEEYISQEDIDNVKWECGNLKSLLKMKPEVFQFLPGNSVKIRRPKPRYRITYQPHIVVNQSCYFEDNHPDGCPLTDEDCTFIHN